MFNIIFAATTTVLFAVLTLKTKTVKNYKTPASGSIFNGLISVVIPARNEEKRLGSLLDSLKQNTDTNFEIIVVNDMSSDSTSQVAHAHEVRLIEINEITPGFLGKTNACNVGAENSNGEVLVFLDADTLVSKNFLTKIRSIFSDTQNNVLTIQPVHKMKNIFEQLSLFFHVSSITATGIFSHINFGFGLYGPCIILRKSIYETTGGFANKDVKSSIIEDVALGEVLQKEDIKISRILGTSIISYTMFTSIKSLFLGWKRNISLGFNKAPIMPSIIIILFYGSLLSMPVLILCEKNNTALLLGIFILEYLLLIYLALRLGNYLISAVLYPISLTFFLLVFFISAISKILKLETSWADRKIQLE